MDLGGIKDMMRDLTRSADQRAVAKALKLYAKGDLDKAIETLKDAQKESPESSAILFELARFLTMAGRGPEAADALRTILRRNPRAFEKVNEMIEEVRARHQNVGPLYDAIAEHFIRHDDLKNGLVALERMKPDEIRVFIPRHRGKWDSLRKNAPDAKMARPSLASAYYLALSHEAVGEYDRAAEIYRTVARTTPEEVAKILPRLEALLAKDYQNSALRLAVADLFLQAGRADQACQQLTLALETDPRSAAPVAEKVAAHLSAGKETPELRFLLVSALQASGDTTAAIEALRPLVEAGALLDQVIEKLQPMTAAEKSGPARRLLAAAVARRGHPQSALETLVQIAEEEGLPAIREPLEALVAASPNLARAHHLLADIHLAERRAAQAVECMRKARDLAPSEDSLLIPKVTRVLEADPASPEAHLLLADLLVNRGDERDRGIVVLRHLVRQSPGSAGQALARFAGILKEDPQSPRGRIGAAEACLELKQFPQALEHYKEVVAAHPELTAEYLHGVVLLAEAAPDLAPGLAETLRALEARSPLPHAVRFALGEAAFFGGDPATAASAFRDVLQGAPDRAEEVREALERFDRDDPRATEARYLLATLYLDRRDHAAAIAELSRGEAVNIALLERVLSKYEEILAATPDDGAARSGYVRALLLARRFDEVLKVGQETLRERDDGSTAPISIAMGDALREKGDPAGAVKRYYAAFGRDRALAGPVTERLRATIQSEGSHALASLALGKVLSSEGKAPEAVEALRAAGAADPKLRDTVLTELKALQVICPGDAQAGLLVLSLLREGRETHDALKTISSLLDAHPELAPDLVDHLEEIIKIDPKLGFAHYELGRAFQRLKSYPRSAASYLTGFRQDAGLAPMILKRLYELMEAAPANPEPYLAACAIHAARGKFPAAAETIQKALLKIPGEIDRLLPRLEEIWKQNRTSSQIALVFAHACLKAEKHEKALTAFSEAAQRDATLFDAAFEGFEAIVNARPKMGEAYLARAGAHAARMRIDQALADLGHACRLAPGAVTAAVEEAEGLHKRLPDSYPCAIHLADFYIAAGKEAEAGRLLKEELERGWGKNERLAILVRLWRLALAAHDDEAARGYLEEAERLAPDRNQFLARVHEVLVATLRAQAGRLRDRAEKGSRRTADLLEALRALVDLGEVSEAETLLDKQAGGLGPQDAARLRAEIALRRGDYPRAAERLRALGPSRALAFGAARAGDFALAAQTLESLATKSTDPALRVALARVYRDMVEADLFGGRRPLQAETEITFTQGAAA